MGSPTPSASPVTCNTTHSWDGSDGEQTQVYAGKIRDLYAYIGKSIYARPNTKHGYHRPFSGLCWTERASNAKEARETSSKDTRRLCPRTPQEARS